MSICYNYMSLADDLLKRARRDRDFLLLLLFSQTTGEEPDDGIEELPPIVNEVIDVGQWWDVLCFLLSPERRQTDVLYEPVDWLGKAIDGLVKFMTMSMRDMVIRVPDAKEVQSVSAALSQDRSSLVQDLDPAALEAADVYCGKSFERLDARIFDRLQGFYERAASKDCAVIVWRS